MEIIIFILTIAVGISWIENWKTAGRLKQLRGEYEHTTYLFNESFLDLFKVSDTYNPNMTFTTARNEFVSEYCLDRAFVKTTKENVLSNANQIININAKINGLERYLGLSKFEIQTDETGGHKFLQYLKPTIKLKPVKTNRKKK